MTMQAEVVDMTGENGRRLRAIGHKIIEMLRAETRSPVEAIAVLHLLVDTFQQVTGVSVTDVVKIDTPEDEPPPPMGRTGEA
jgi:hypothetical protein